MGTCCSQGADTPAQDDIAVPEHQKQTQPTIENLPELDVLQLHADAPDDAVDHLELAGIILHDVEEVEKEHAASPTLLTDTLIRQRSRVRSFGNIGGEDGLDVISRATSVHSLRSKQSSGNRKSAGAKEEEKEEVRPELQGEWICIDTWGMDDFLKDALNIGWLQRSIAAKAAWPRWEFTKLHDDIFLFANHGALGVIEEEIDVGGPEYTSYDGHKQKITNKAYWTGSGEASKLVIERQGPQGHFTEERSLDENKHLVFVLTCTVPKTGKECKWGRKFKRKSS